MGQIKEISPLRPTPPVRPKVKRQRQEPVPAQDKDLTEDSTAMEEDFHDHHIDEFI
jgi:hypothetical protein